MLPRLFKLLLFFAVMGSLALVIWPFARQQLSDNAQHSRIAVDMDKATAAGNQFVGPALTPLRTIMRPMVGYVFHQDYAPDIRAPLTAAELDGIIQENHQNFGKRIVLLYLYDLQCALCSANYEDINAIAQAYPKDRVLVLALAVGTTAEQLSEFMNRHGGLPAFKPLLLQEGEAVKLAAIPSFTAAEFTQAPYIGIVDESGRMSKLPFGPERGVLIRTKLDEMLK